MEAIIRKTTLLRIDDTRPENDGVSMPAQGKIPEGFRYGLKPYPPRRLTNGGRVSVRPNHYRDGPGWLVSVNQRQHQLGRYIEDDVGRRGAGSRLFIN
jgi:hypothetical protein